MEKARKINFLPNFSGISAFISAGGGMKNKPYKGTEEKITNFIF